MGTSNSFQKVAIIAGSGSLPIELAKGSIGAGIEPYVVGIRDVASAEVENFQHVYLGFGQIGKLFEILHEREISHVVFAGGIKIRPDFTNLKLDWLTVKLLPKILSLMASGDNTLLSGVIKIFESENITMVGAHEIAPQLLCEENNVVGRMPGRKILENIRLGYDACKRLGSLDAGQAVIVEAGRVVALEGAEGTDAMIARVEALRLSGQMPPQGKYGVLVKTMKPGQDMRADLPSIGPETIDNIKRAGLLGVALEAGCTLILDREETLARARAEKIFIYGMVDEDG
ncbi:MAG: UDP-2,3-diacylglucosamine diphosphatase LpxI [Rhizobiaceae bacterium]|nr:UDP-2,3-diacylglucosamine diphosphatase LpxI [Rhizobiaceae bacterium]